MHPQNQFSAYTKVGPLTFATTFKNSNKLFIWENQLHVQYEMFLINSVNFNLILQTGRK